IRAAATLAEIAGVHVRALHEALGGSGTRYAAVGTAGELAGGVALTFEVGPSPRISDAAGRPGAYDIAVVPAAQIATGVAITTEGDVALTEQGAVGTASAGAGPGVSI